MTTPKPGIDAKQAVVDALLAERYGPSLWWKTPEKTAAEQDAAVSRAALDLAYDADEDATEETA